MKDGLTYGNLLVYWLLSFNVNEHCTKAFNDSIALVGLQGVGFGADTPDETDY